MKAIRTLAALKAEWQEFMAVRATSARGSRRLARPKGLKVRCSAFRETMETLARATKDQRFRDVLKAIEEHNLVDSTGHWRRAQRRHWEDIAEMEPGELVDWVHRLIDAGRKPHRAFAEIACDWVEDAPTFESACKRVSRAYDEALKQLEIRTRSGHELSET